MNRDSGEFVQLITGAQPAVLGYIMSLGFDHARAKDILQETSELGEALYLERQLEGLCDEFFEAVESVERKIEVNARLHHTVARNVTGQSEFPDFS